MLLNRAATKVYTATVGDRYWKAADNIVPNGDHARPEVYTVYRGDGSYLPCTEYLLQLDDQT